MVFSNAFRAGWGAVRRSKRLLLCAALTTALISLPFGFWAGRAADVAGARRPDAKLVARSLDPDFFADVRAANPSFDADAAALVAAALVLMFFVKPLVTGGFVGIAATQKRLSFGKFVREGGNVYWKFLRISAVEVVVMLGLSLALKPLLTTFDDWAQGAPGEDAARSRTWAAEGLAFGALCAVAMVFDYARIGVRMRRRPGVLAEIGRAAMFVVQHPFRTTGFYFAGLLLEIAVCAPFFLLVRIADGGYVLSSGVVLLLGQGVVALREGARLFHLAGAWRIRQAEELPQAPARRPDESDGQDLLGERLPWHVS